MWGGKEAARASCCSGEESARAIFYAASMVREDCVRYDSSFEESGGMAINAARKRPSTSGNATQAR